MPISTPLSYCPAIASAKTLISYTDDGCWAHLLADGAVVHRTNSHACAHAHALARAQTIHEHPPANAARPSTGTQPISRHTRCVCGIHTQLGLC